MDAINFQFGSNAYRNEFRHKLVYYLEKNSGNREWNESEVKNDENYIWKAINHLRQLRLDLNLQNWKSIDSLWKLIQNKTISGERNRRPFLWLVFPLLSIIIVKRHQKIVHKIEALLKSNNSWKYQYESWLPIYYCCLSFNSLMSLIY